MVAAYRRTHSPNQLAWSEGGGRLVLSSVYEQRDDTF